MLKAFTMVVWNAIKEFLVIVWNKIKSFFASALENFVNFWKGIWEGVKSIFINIWEGIKDTFSGVIDFINEGIQKVLKAFEKMKAIVTSPIKAVGGFIRGVQNVGRQILGFQQGGVVPGPPGTPQLAVVHGGETISPAGRGGGLTIVITGNTIVGGDAEDVAQAMIDMVISRLNLQIRINIFILVYEPIIADTPR